MKENRKPSIKQAVALRYSAEEMLAPKVVAKGRGEVAEEILRKAKEHNIPVQEDSSLVEVLSQLEIDREIPPELYKLVAELLSYVYRTDNRAKGSSGGKPLI